MLTTQPPQATRPYSHPGVKEAAVLAIPDDLVGNRLRALVVRLEGHEFTIGDLEAHCIQRLPRHMVPERIELRNELPRTSTGKINRPLLAHMS